MSAREIVVRLRAEIGNFVRDMRQAGDATTAAAAATRTSGQQMQTAMTQTQAEAAETRKALLDAGKAAQESAKGYGLSYNAAGQLTDQFGNLVTEAHAAELGLETASEATQEYAAQATHAAAEAAAATEASRSGIDSLLAQAAANEEAWDKVGKGLLGFGAAVMVGVGLSIAKFSEFDSAMSSVDAATHETAANMELLREKAIEVGADTAFSATEAAQGIEELAKAGVSTNDILSGGLIGSMDLAAAGALGVGDAAELAATAMTQFKLSGAEIPHIADLLAAGAGKAQGSVQDLGGGLKQAGLVASQVGLTIEETVGGLSAFAAAGLVGSDAGTSFKSMLQRLTPTSKESAKLMDELGISAYDAQGNFIGLEAFAGNLQESMADLTVEQRNAAMSTIFGSDAVRAAAVMYEQGAEGVGDWISAVNDAGYAAETTARMQDNLAGDIEKLGGAMDTVFIKGGTGAANMLRGVVQGVEGLVDSVGSVPTPVLAAATAAAALIGGVALLGGAFVTLVPKIAATKVAMTAFATGSPRMAAGLIGVGKAAGIAAIGIFAVVGASAALGKTSVVDVDKMSSSLLNLSNAGADIDSIFNEETFAVPNDTGVSANRIRNLGDALKEVTEIDFGATVNRGLGSFLNGFGAKTTTRLMETTKIIEAMDEGLANLASSGNAEQAATAFQKVVAAGEESGVSAEKTAGQFSKYQNALRKQALAMKVALTDEEVYQWALGNTPPKIKAVQESAEGQTQSAIAQQEANEAVAEALADVGLAADGTVQSLGKLLEAMFAAGLSTMSTRDASRSYKDTLDAMSAAVATNGYTLDTNTKAGRANEAALDAIAQAGIRHAEAMANETDAAGNQVYSQEQVSAALKTTYDDLVANYAQFGITGDGADTLARKVLGVPKGVKIDTAIQNFADSMGKLHGVGDAVNGIPNSKTITIYGNVDPSFRAAAEEAHRLGQVKTAPGVNVNTEVSGVGGGYAQGGLVGFASGGVVPGRPPADLRRDNVLALVNGKPVGLQSGEFVMPTMATRANLPMLEAMRAGQHISSYVPPSKSLEAGYAPALSRSAYEGSGSGLAATVIENHYHFDVSAPAGVSPEVAAQSLFAVAMRKAR